MEYRSHCCKAHATQQRAPHPDAKPHRAEVPRQYLTYLYPITPICATKRSGKVLGYFMHLLTCRVSHHIICCLDISIRMLTSCLIHIMESEVDCPVPCFRSRVRLDLSPFYLMAVPPVLASGLPLSLELQRTLSTPISLDS